MADVRDPLIGRALAEAPAPAGADAFTAALTARIRSRRRLGLVRRLGLTIAATAVAAGLLQVALTLAQAAGAALGGGWIGMLPLAAVGAAALILLRQLLLDLE